MSCFGKNLNFTSSHVIYARAVVLFAYLLTTPLHGIIILMLLHFLQVLVEFDYVDFMKREWIHVYRAQLHLFLIENTLCMAPRTVAPFSKDGILHPALVSLFVVDLQNLIAGNCTIYNDVSDVPCTGRQCWSVEAETAEAGRVPRRLETGLSRLRQTQNSQKMERRRRSGRCQPKSQNQGGNPSMGRTARLPAGTALVL